MDQVRTPETTEERETLDEIVRRIRACGDPLKIVLFGSRARGEAHPGSDFDILIVEESDLPRHRRGGKYYQILTGLGTSKDIVVWTPEEIAEWRNVPNAFITTAMREGRVLYEGSG